MKHLRDKQLTLNGSQPGELSVMATGGGAYKYYDLIREALGVDVVREDEMECLIIGEPLLDLVLRPPFLTIHGQVLISSSPRYPAKYSPILRMIPWSLLNLAKTYTPTC